MPDNTPYYFQVLPIHPRPEPLESMSSYLIRLAENNYLTTIPELSRLVFPNQDAKITGRIADYPPMQFEFLSEAAFCPKNKLLTTTFHHVSKKFGRSTHPQAVSRFLSGMVSDHFRYCPRCIIEKGYYSLEWRFNLVTSCPEHGCLLLDCCEQCGNPIPFLGQILKIGICSKCNFNFGLSTSEEVSQHAQTISVHKAKQYEFLLTPQTFEKNAPEIMYQVGIYLSTLRKKQGITRIEMAKLIGVSRTIVEGIEVGEGEHVGSLVAYASYIGYFGLGFHEIFQEATNSNLVKSKKPVYKEELISKVEETIQRLQKSRKAVNWRKIARLSRISEKTLRARPIIRQMIYEAKQQEYQDQKRQLLLAIENLILEGKSITIASVARSLGFKRGRIEHNLEFLDLICKAKSNQSISRI